MTMERLPRIPTPWRLHWREFRVKVFPVLVFGTVLTAAIRIWTEYVMPPTLVGQVESSQANVSSTRPGTLTQLQVTRFSVVHARDPIAQVIVTDPRILESSLAVIRAQVALLRAGIQPLLNQQRNELTYERLRLDWLNERVQLATARVKLQYAEAELARVGSLFGGQTNIVSQMTYQIAVRDRDALLAETSERTNLVLELDKALQRLNLMDAALSPGRADETMRAAIAAQEEQLKLTEAQLRPVSLLAPIDGVVTMIYRHSGENIATGEPVLTIQSTQAERIIAYVHQPLMVDPQIGMRAELRSRSTKRAHAVGQVISVGAALETIPPALVNAFTGKSVELGLPIAISVPAGLRALPGELLDVRLLPER
jgi:multidrug resistance efflux pump